MPVNLMMRQYSFVLLQERGSILPGTLGANVAFGLDNDSDRAPAVILHRALVPKIIGSFSDTHVCGARLALEGVRSIMMSMYLADTGQDWNALESFMKQQEQCLARLVALSAVQCRLVCAGG
jgi:hypothetical protein